MWFQNSDWAQSSPNNRYYLHNCVSLSSLKFQSTLDDSLSPSPNGIDVSYFGLYAEQGELERQIIVDQEVFINTIQIDDILQERLKLGQLDSRQR